MQCYTYNGVEICRSYQVYLPTSTTKSNEIIWNESVPMQLALCRFPRPAISNAKILILFSSKIYGSNFIKKALGNCHLFGEITKMLIAAKANNFTVSFTIIFPISEFIHWEILISHETS